MVIIYQFFTWVTRFWVVKDGVGAVCGRFALRLLVITWYPCYHVYMIRSFVNQGTEDIFNGVNSKFARRTCPNSLWRIASRKLDQLDSVESLSELRVSPGNHLEALSGDRAEQHSIRINDQYRICFTWQDNAPGDVEIVDYH